MSGLAAVPDPDYVEATFWVENRKIEVKVCDKFANSDAGYKKFIDAAAEAWTRLTAPLEVTPGER